MARLAEPMGRWKSEPESTRARAKNRPFTALLRADCEVSNMFLTFPIFSICSACSILCIPYILSSPTFLQNSRSLLSCIVVFSFEDQMADRHSKYFHFTDLANSLLNVRLSKKQSKKIEQE